MNICDLITEHLALFATVVGLFLTTFMACHLFVAKETSREEAMRKIFRGRNDD